VRWEVSLVRSSKRARTAAQTSSAIDITAAFVILGAGTSAPGLTPGEAHFDDYNIATR